MVARERRTAASLAVLAALVAVAALLVAPAYAQGGARAGNLTGSDTAAGSQFGAAVLSVGGETLAGAPGHGNRHGAVYAFATDAHGYAQAETQRLYPRTDLPALLTAPGDSFGRALDVSGDVLVVGAPGFNGTGGVFLYKRVNGLWANASVTLPPPETLSVGTTTTTGVYDDDDVRFGFSVGLAANVLMVGALGWHGERGAVYLFTVEDAGGDAPLQTSFVKLLEPTVTDKAGGDTDQVATRFGYSLALDGNVAVVGAPANDTSVAAVYIYEWLNDDGVPTGDTSGTFTFVSRRANVGGDAGSNFGWSTAVSSVDHSILVGAYTDSALNGSATFLHRAIDDDSPNGYAWEVLTRLVVKQGTGYGSWFGYSVALGEQYAAVGAMGESLLTGSTYVFNRDTETACKWLLDTRLTRVDSASFEQFAAAQSINDAVLYVGAPGYGGSEGIVQAFCLTPACAAIDTSVTCVDTFELRRGDGGGGGTSAGVAFAFFVLGVVCLVALLCCGYAGYRRAYQAKYNRMAPSLFGDSHMPAISKDLMERRQAFKEAGDDDHATVAVDLGASAVNTPMMIPKVIVAGPVLWRHDNCEVFEGITVGRRRVMLTQVDFTSTNAVQVMRSLSHENLLPVLGVHQNRKVKDLWFLVSVFPKLGGIAPYLRRRGTIFSYEDVGRIAVEVASGLAYLHSRGALHTSLTVDAVNLVGSITPHLEDVQVKLSDVMLTKLIPHHGAVSMATRMDVSRYLPPEALLDGFFDATGDVYMFGMLLWELCNRCILVPFETATRVISLDEIIEGYTHNAVYTPHRPPDCPKPLYEVMAMCWRRSPGERPSAQQLVDELQQAMQTMHEAGDGERPVVPIAWFGSRKRAKNNAFELLDPRNLFALLRGGGGVGGSDGGDDGLGGGISVQAGDLDRERSNTALYVRKASGRDIEMGDSVGRGGSRAAPDGVGALDFDGEAFDSSDEDELSSSAVSPSRRERKAARKSARDARKKAERKAKRKNSRAALNKSPVADLKKNHDRRGSFGIGDSQDLEIQDAEIVASMSPRSVAAAAAAAEDGHASSGALKPASSRSPKKKSKSSKSSRSHRRKRSKSKSGGLSLHDAAAFDDMLANAESGGIAGAAATEATGGDYDALDGVSFDNNGEDDDLDGMELSLNDI